MLNVVYPKFLIVLHPFCAFDKRARNVIFVIVVFNDVVVDDIVAREHRKQYLRKESSSILL